MGSFKISRWNWTMKVQEKFATPIFYKKIWPNSEVKSTDKMAKDSSIWERRDFDGLDKIIFLPGGNEIHLAQRFRSADSRDDFSLRYEVPDDKGGIQKSEYFKLLKAYKKEYWYPDLYAFGNTTFGKSNNLENVGPNPFKNFFIFRVEALIKGIYEGRIEKRGPYPNTDPKTGKKDGSSGVYFKVDEFPSEVFEYRFDLRNKEPKLEEFEKEEEETPELVLEENLNDHG